MSKNKHIHRFTRVKLAPKSLTQVMKCNLPGCNSYYHLTVAIGQECLCNRCDKPMILTSRMITQKKPHCRKCTSKNLRGRAANPIKRKDGKFASNEDILRSANAEDVGTIKL